ncbi:MAG: ATPase, T2SS/T4P/T4SS family [Halobacteriaceae archaeon]
MHDLLDAIRPGEPDCACEAAFDGDRLTLTADDCPGNGALATEPACRATAVEALRRRDADTVVTRATGTERRYTGRAAALLTAAGRFAERIADRDERLAARTERDPLGAATEATGRAGPAATAAAETGLAAVADAAADYDDALRAFVGPTVAKSRVARTPPADAELVETRDPEGPASARVYAVPGDELDTYHLEPATATLSDAGRRALAAARDYLSAGRAGDGDRAPARAVRAVADADLPVGRLADALTAHTRGHGVLEDLFADPGVSDVFASAPAAANDLRVTVEGETMRTNVRLTETGAETLASQLRRASGRAFSRANPTLDAVAENVGAADRVRAAGVTAPVADGTGFAFRAHSGPTPTLPWLVGEGMPAEPAALLSLAVERGVAALVAGTRGAGKTTLLSALLWELPAAVRICAIEDTPELPVEALQSHGRDVQALRTELDADRGVSPSEALRTALRLGEGALAVGEVRGEEAQTLYEAMRVGASGSAVLGTIHGDGAEAVRERVVSDLGVPESAFAATDLVVTMESVRTPSGTARRLAGVEEVGQGDDGVWFAPLYDRSGGGLQATGRLRHGDSHLLASLTRGEESYADVLAALDERARDLSALADGERTDPSAVIAAGAERRA